MKIIHQQGKNYILVASAEECNRIEGTEGIDIENANKYGLKAVRSPANAKKEDNLRRLPKLKR